MSLKYLIIAIVGILLTVISGIFNMLPEIIKEYLLKVPYFRTFILIIGILAIIVGGSLSIRNEYIKYKQRVFVSPGKYKVHPGRIEKFKMFVTNNENYPVYQINVSLEIISGDLSANNIRIPSTKKEEPELTGELVDKNGKLTTNFEVFIITGISPGKDYPDLMGLIINNIPAHSSKAFIIEIDSRKCKVNSNISFKIGNYSKEPSIIIQGPWFEK